MTPVVVSIVLVVLQTRLTEQASAVCVNKHIEKCEKALTTATATMEPGFPAGCETLDNYFTCMHDACGDVVPIVNAIQMLTIFETYKLIYHLPCDVTGILDPTCKLCVHGKRVDRQILMSLLAGLGITAGQALTAGAVAAAGTVAAAGVAKVVHDNAGLLHTQSHPVTTIPGCVEFGATSCAVSFAKAVNTNATDSQAAVCADAKAFNDCVVNHTCSRTLNADAIAALKQLQQHLDILNKACGYANIVRKVGEEAAKRFDSLVG